MSDAFQSTFDHYLRERGISTKRASMMTGISYDCIRRCRIQGIFSVRHLLTICTTFGVSSDYLLELTEEKSMPATYREFFYVLRFMMDQQMILRQLVCDDAAGPREDFVMTGSADTHLRSYVRLSTALEGDTLKNRMLDLWATEHEKDIVPAVNFAIKSEDPVVKKYKYVFNERFDAMLRSQNIKKAKISSFLARNRIYYSDGVITRYRTSILPADISVLIALSYYFEVSTDYLLGLTAFKDRPLAGCKLTEVIRFMFTNQIIQPVLTSDGATLYRLTDPIMQDFCDAFEKARSLYSGNVQKMWFEEKSADFDYPLISQAEASRFRKLHTEQFDEKLLEQDAEMLKQIWKENPNIFKADAYDN